MEFVVFFHQKPLNKKNKIKNTKKKKTQKLKYASLKQVLELENPSQTTHRRHHPNLTKPIVKNLK